MFRAPVLYTVLLLVLAAVSGAAADTVKLIGKPAFEGVRVTGFQDGRLAFRGVSGQMLRKPFAQIEWIAVDRADNFNAAEQAAAGANWAGAAAGYGAAGAELAEPSLRTYAAWRELAVLDKGGRFADAVRVFLGHAAEISELPPAPRRPGPPGSAENRRAMEQLVAALSPAPGTAGLGDPNSRKSLLRPAVAPARLLLSEICLIEGVSESSDAVRAAFGGAASSGERPKFGAIFGDAAAADLPELPPDTFVVDTIRQQIESAQTARAEEIAAALLPRINQHPETSAQVRILLGRARIANAKPADAAADLLGLSQAAPTPAIAAEAGYYVGLAQEKLAQPEVAAGFYRETLAAAGAPDEVRKLAAAGLRRVTITSRGFESGSVSKSGQEPR